MGRDRRQRQRSGVVRDEEPQVRIEIRTFPFPPAIAVYLSENVFRAFLGVPYHGRVGKRQPRVVLKLVENPLAGARIVASVYGIQDEAVLSDPFNQLFHCPSFKALHVTKIPQLRSITVFSRSIRTHTPARSRSS